MSLILLILLYLAAASIESPKTRVRNLIFDNKKRGVVVYFEDPVIIEDIHLLKKVRKGDSIQVGHLTAYIEKPKNYYDKVLILQNELYDKKNVGKALDAAKTKQVYIDLSDEDFEREVPHVLAIKLLNIEDLLYTEQFLYVGNKIIHVTEYKSSRIWYNGPWFWIVISLVILCGMFVLRIFVC